MREIWTALDSDKNLVELDRVGDGTYKLDVLSAKTHNQVSVTITVEQLRELFSNLSDELWRG